MKRLAFDYESLTSPPHAQQRSNYGTREGAGALRQNNNGFYVVVDPGILIGPSSGSYSCIRLENSYLSSLLGP